MKKYIYIILLSLSVVSIMGFIHGDNNKSKYWMYNTKGQLIADTNILADNRLGEFYKDKYRRREIRIYSEILNTLTVSSKSIESGCIGEIILKLYMVKDTNNEVDFLIKDISPIFDTTDNCLMYQYEANRLSLIGQRIRSSPFFNAGYTTNCFYMYVPIKTKLNFYNYYSFEPSVKKYIENGYFVIEVNTFYQ